MSNSKIEEEINTVKLYYVSWFSRYGKFCADTEKEIEAFTSLEDAEAFAKDLENAFKILRHTSGTEIKVYEK